MDDKVFQLLEKLYIDMQNGFKHVDSRFDNLENRVLKIESTLENDIKPKVSLCLEELSSVKEKLSEHDKRFDSIEEKIVSHDVEIKVLKRAK